MSTHRVSVREARQHLRRMLDQVKAGEEVVVLRRDAEAGKLVRPERKIPLLPGVSSLRASVKIRGER